MNIELVRALKPAMNKINNNNAYNKAEDLTDKKTSFSKSLNEFLEKNSLKDKKDLGRVDKYNETKDIKKENKEDNFSYLGVLNTEPLMTNKYPEETVLNTENRLELLINVDTEIEGLVGAEIKNLDLFGDELRLMSEGEKETSSQNFSIEGAKMNLDKALGKDVSHELLAKGIGKEVIIENSDGKLVGLQESDLKAEVAGALGEELSKEKPIKDADIISATKETLLKSGSINRVGEIEGDSLEPESIHFNKLLDKSIDKALKSDGNEEELEKIVDTKITETPRSLEINFMMNRIQNSFISQEDLKGVMSPENLQSVQDEMIHFMKISKEGDASVMRVKLYPEELGSIDISLKFQNGKLMADIIVQNEAIKEMFLNGSSLLNKNLLEQNIPLKNINVTVSENLNTFENSNNEAGQGREGQANKTRDLNRSDIGGSNSNQNPTDDIRIDRINKTNKGLDILV